MSPSLLNEFVDIDQTLVFNYQLQPGQTIAGLQQPISGDGDFHLCGMQVTSVLLQKPTLVELQGFVGVRIADDVGYKLMSGFISNKFMTPQQGNSYPYVIRPAHMFKAGTRINIDLQEQSNVTDPISGPVPNIVQILFRGRYRYRMDTLRRLQQERKGLSGVNMSRGFR